MEGLAFGESLRWHDGRLWASDWGTGQVLTLDSRGSARVVCTVESSPLCFDFLGDGQLVVADSGGSKLCRLGLDGGLVEHAFLGGEGAPPWNEVVADTRRAKVYVNNIGFEFPAGEPKPGFVAVAANDGSVRRAAEDLAFPNGMIITPDGASLIVAESWAGHLSAFDLAPNGDLSNRRVWADLGEGAPDGICMDAEGAIWYGDVPNQECVRVLEGGKVTDRVAFDRGCFSCVLGEAEGPALFVAATRWTGPGELNSVATGQILTVPVAIPAPSGQMPEPASGA